jgi:predicted Zn finger-like uncharacterized protein
MKWIGGECGGTAQRVKARKRRSHFQHLFFPMSKSEPISFNCPACEAEYKIVTIEVCDVQQGKVRCLKCDALFPAVEGSVAFKYFLVRGPSRRK